jgi:hypothetical protein
MCRATGLPECDAYRGVGWLAREGKLTLERRKKRREARVARAATVVRQLLRLHGPMAMPRLRERSGLSRTMIDEAIGWLAREGRLAVRSRTNAREFRIGEAAGRIWRLAHARGVLARKDLRRAGLTESVANQAIGWLAREGKLVVEERRGERAELPHRIVEVLQPASDDSLADRPKRDALLALEQGGQGQAVAIGEFAGQIVKALSEHGSMSEGELGAETGLEHALVDQGIGWLAREGKLHIGRDRKGYERFRLADTRDS